MAAIHSKACHLRDQAVTQLAGASREGLTSHCSMRCASTGTRKDVEEAEINSRHHSSTALKENLDRCPLPVLQIMMDSVLASSVDYSMKDAQGRPPSGPKCETDQRRMEICFCNFCSCIYFAHFSGVHDISTWELIGLLPWFSVCQGFMS